MEAVKKAIQQVCKELFDVEVEPVLSRPDEQFGDYATNIALQLAGRLNKNPKELAEQIAEHVKGSTSHIQSVEVADPGFINIRLPDEVLIAATKSVTPTVYDQQKIVIETNNPNPFKDLHIGHAYNSIVADTIANLLAAGGGEVHRVSYHGDVGLHVGKSMWAILKNVDNDPKQLDAITEAERPVFLSKMYAEGAVAYEQDDLAKQQIEAYSGQSFVLDDPVFEQVYQICKDWSFAYFDQVFGQLGSKPVERRFLERETDLSGRQIVEANIGKVFEHSDGAIIFSGEKYGLHTRVFINSRGNTLYEARDLGLIELKYAEFKPYLSYIVTANEQKEYFRVVLKAAELAMPNMSTATRNVSTGTVKLSTGKMSSRTGNVVNIGWLFEELEKAIRVRSNNEETVEQGVVGALRYTMLKNRIGQDLVFDINDAISLEGNSGPYLQYAHARARSILLKSTVHSLESIAKDSGLRTLDSSERSLVRKISEYNEVLEDAVRELAPHSIGAYLHELAQTFNSFYEHNRVINDPREEIRVAIVKSYADTLQNGLNLLGIPAPEHM